MKINVSFDIPEEMISLLTESLGKLVPTPTVVSGCCQEEAEKPEPEPEPEPAPAKKPRAKKAPAKKAPAKKKKVTKKEETELREHLTSLAMEYSKVTSQVEVLDLARKYLGQRLSTDYAAPEDDVREVGRDPEQKLTKLPQLAVEDLAPVIEVLVEALAEKGISKSA